MLSVKNIAKPLPLFIPITLFSYLVCMLSCVQLFATSWTVVHQAPLSWQEYWSGLPFLLQGIFLTQGLKPCLCSSCIGKWILYHWATWEVLSYFNTLPRQHWLIILIAGILLFFCYYYKWSIVLLFKLLYVIRFWEILYLSNFIKYFLFYLAIFWNDYVFYEMCCLHLILVNSYVFSPLLIDTLEYIERLFWLKLFTHFSK